MRSAASSKDASIVLLNRMSVVLPVVFSSLKSPFYSLLISLTEARYHFTSPSFLSRRRDSTSQAPRSQVGTPSFGRITSCNSSHAAMIPPIQSNCSMLFLHRKTGVIPRRCSAINVVNVFETRLSKDFRAFLRTRSRSADHIDRFALIQFCQVLF